MKNNFNEREIEQIEIFINSIDNEKEYYDFMFHLCCVLRFSIEEIVEFYNGSTFDDIKRVLVEKFNVEFKWCSGCNKTRSVTSFTRQSKTNSYYRSRCKICMAKEKKQYRSIPEVREKHINYMSEYNPIYQSKNKESLKQTHHEYYELNKEVLLPKQKAYHANTSDIRHAQHREYYKQNKDQIIQNSRQYKEEHPEQHKQYMKEYTEIHHDRLLDYKNGYNRNKYATDTKHRLRVCFGANLYNSIKKLKAGRKWEDIVGYTLEQLMWHLESKFDDNMSWDNYGSYWHVDHIVGVANFNYNSYDDEAFKKCWSLANLQPLYGPDNMAKGDIISEEWNNVELAAQLL